MPTPPACLDMFLFLRDSCEACGCGCGWVRTGGACRVCVVQVKCLRPDRLVEFISSLAALVLGAACVETPPLDVRRVIETQTAARAPLLLVSRPGYDASQKIETLAAAMPGYQVKPTRVSGCVSVGASVCLCFVSVCVYLHVSVCLRVFVSLSGCF